MKRTGLVFGATAKLIAGGAIVCGLLAASAALADVKEGVDAYNAGDYKKAIDEWMPAAAKNDPAALFNLGQVYRLGKGVKPDVHVAESYYMRAAELGHVPAQGNLASLYLDRKGELFDPKKGIEWLTKAAYRGNTLSRYMLGVIYFNGEFVAQDSVEAYAWISLAASQGFPDAVKAEQTVVSQMSVLEISEGKKRQAVVAKKSDETMAADAAEHSSQPTSEKAEAQPAAAPARTQVAEAAPTAEKASDWVNPDEQPAEKAPVKEAALPSTPPAPEPAESTDGNTPISSFGIQVASLRSEPSAIATWNALTTAHPDLLGGLKRNIERADLGEKGVYYRLQAGSLASYADAQALCAKLKDLDVGCLPLRR